MTDAGFKGISSLNGPGRCGKATQPVVGAVHVWMDQDRGERVRNQQGT